jgi:hypothetical protein
LVSKEEVSNAIKPAKAARESGLFPRPHDLDDLQSNLHPSRRAATKSARSGSVAKIISEQERSPEALYQAAILNSEATNFA